MTTVYVLIVRNEDVHDDIVSVHATEKTATMALVAIMQRQLAEGHKDVGKYLTTSEVYSAWQNLTRGDSHWDIYEAPSDGESERLYAVGLDVSLEEVAAYTKSHAESSSASAAKPKAE
jgi:hypothetical protein